MLADDIEPDECVDLNPVHLEKGTHHLEVNALRQKARNYYIGEWPTTTSSLCLHCAEAIDGPPLPVVAGHEPLTGKYSVYGCFCSAACSLGHIAERGGADAARTTVWTRLVLQKYFSIPPGPAAPPRTALQKYGGPLSVAAFRSRDFIKVIQGPFVAHAMVLQMRGDPALDTSDLTNLKRPTERRPPAQQQPTGDAPLLLEFLCGHFVDPFPPKRTRTVAPAADAASAPAPKKEKRPYKKSQGSVTSNGPGRPRKHKLVVPAPNPTDTPMSVDTAVVSAVTSSLHQSSFIPSAPSVSSLASLASMPAGPSMPGAPSAPANADTAAPPSPTPPTVGQKRARDFVGVMAFARPSKKTTQHA